MSYAPYKTTSYQEYMKDGTKYHVTNTNIVDNNHYNNVDNVYSDKVVNDGAFKIRVIGNVGNGVKIALLNLDDIQAVQLPSG